MVLAQDQAQINGKKLKVQKYSIHTWTTDIQYRSKHNQLGVKDIFPTSGAVIIYVQKKKKLNPYITPGLVLQTHSIQYYKFSVTDPFYSCSIYKVI